MKIFNENSTYKFKSIIRFILIAYLCIAVATSFPLAQDLYIITTGDISPMNEHIGISNSKDKKIDNDINMITVLSSKFNILSYAIYYILNKGEISVYSNEDILHPSYNLDDQYWHDRQERIQSYNAAYIAAAKVAGKTISFTKKVLYAGNSSNNPSFPLQRNDEILSINDKEIHDIKDLYYELNEKRTANVRFVRNGKLYNQIVDYKNFYPYALLTTYKFDSKETIEIKDSENDTQSSSGLMSSIYFYFLMTNKTIPLKYKICGTGTIDSDGNVGQIGGIDYKVLAAKNAGCDIMFVPESIGFFDTNDEDAKEALKRLDSKMKIYSVPNLQSAINILENLE